MTIGAPLLAMGTTSALQTQEVASSLAALVQAGDLLVLCGDLGAGKTAFTQGFGRALGVTTPITSPTFTLANRYEGDALTVNHLDVYRLSHIDEVQDLLPCQLLLFKHVVALPAEECFQVAGDTAKT